MKVYLHKEIFMIVTFCGHSDFKDNGSYTQIMLDFLEKTVGDCSAEMYLGGYGGFDAFACKCCKKYKENHSDISLIFVSPYVISERQKNLYSSYDHIVYPGIENIPPKFAILHRNRYMVEKADCVIAYITHSWGGAYSTYEYARRKGKMIFNLAEL